MNIETSEADKHFIEQRGLILQEINKIMDSILNNLNGLNISLENSIAVGKEFESVSELWKTFYDGLASTTSNTGNNSAFNSSFQDLVTDQNTED